MIDESASPSAGVIGWASRAGGAVGIVTAVLYLGLIFGEGDLSQLSESIVWFLIMLTAGLLSWFADRARAGLDRKILLVAGAMFLGLGVLSILSIGMLFLVACLFSVFALSGSRRGPVANVDPERP